MRVLKRTQRYGVKFVQGNTFIVLFFSLLSVHLAVSQTPDQLTKFRLAQTYEQAGDFERAADAYEVLLRADSSNVLYFEGLRRVYLQLKKYDEAIALIRSRLSRTPDDVALEATLGGVYYKAGMEKEATAAWERAIAIDPKNQNVYRVVANVQLENRLLDKAAEIYRRARAALSDPQLFTIDLAQLLAVSMDYAGSTREYVRWIRQNPNQLGFVQGRMASFTGREEARNLAIDVVTKEIGREENVRLYELLGWLHLEGKDFNRALDVYRRIDVLTKSGGSNIYTFADRAFKEGAYAVAAKAYREATQVPVPATLLPAAKYGYASSLMHLSLLADTLTAEPLQQFPESEAYPRYAGAISYFRNIIAEYPRSEYSARSYYQIGTIQFERFFDLDGALASFEQVELELPAVPLLQFSVALKIGEILVAKGDTASAAKRFGTVLAAPNATPDLHDEAAYRLAELEYFGARFQEAIDRLSGITFNLKADYANDALQLLSFLQENLLTGEAALKEYARADFFARQRKNSEAIRLLLEVIEQYPKALLVDDALMRVAFLEAQAGRYDEAIGAYERLLSSFAETSIALDRAQFNIGKIYEQGLRNPAKAIAAYETLLSRYPQSLLANEARKRIRDLRGDSL
jgi:tetratricopeptide (TPR) repeat protein